MMLLDFHDLKTVSVANGEVTLRIPRRWNVFPDERTEGYWGCYEEGDNHTGTIWIQVDHFDYPEGKPRPLSFADEDIVGDVIENMKSKLPPLLESSTTKVDQGYRWFRVYDVEEDGELLRFWFSHFFLECGNHGAIISFNFVLAHEQMNAPEFIELRDIMEREISAAFLDPFRVIDEQEAEGAFGPLIRCNFNDQVKLILPEAMGISTLEEDDAENQWYCRLTMGPSHAGMFVYVDDFQFALDVDENDGDDLNEDEHRLAQLMFERVFQAMMSERIDTPGGEHRVRRTPWGAVFYDMIEDDDPGEDAEAGDLNSDEEDAPLRTHKWKVLCQRHLEQRHLEVLLMVPVTEAETAPYRQLLAYLDRAIYRAEFPGYREVEAY